MSRYIIQFYKKDAIQYISHLDLFRLFKRTFKRTGLQLVYSHGFNPHPKMSFAQPLSLGYIGEREYLDFETVDLHDCREIMEKLNAALPCGVSVTGCRQLPESKRTLAAIVEYASYTVQFPRGNLHVPQMQTWMSEFLSQKEILVEKKQKKTGRMVTTDIRPMVLDMKCEEEHSKSADLTAPVSDNYIMLTLLICAGSNRNLNPEILLSAFCRQYDIPFLSEEIAITRNELFYRDPSSEKLTSLFDFEPVPALKNIK